MLSTHKLINDSGWVMGIVLWGVKITTWRRKRKILVIVALSHNQVVMGIV